MPGRGYRHARAWDHLKRCASYQQCPVPKCPVPVLPCSIRPGSHQPWCAPDRASLTRMPGPAGPLPNRSGPG